MKFSATNLLLVLVTLFFLFTRFYKISEIPASVYWDEASIGYNAYSLVQTGKDEWGEFFPLHFRAFGEFKLPVYIYATAISVKLFGLNAFAVRLPAVLFSLGVMILTYFLAKKLWANEAVGLLSSFFVSVSPWFFIFSRTGYEVMAGLMFFILGVYLFLHIKERNFFLPLSVLSLILSMYSYNSFRIIVPLTLIILAAFYYDTLVYHSKTKLLLVISVVLVLLSLIPIIRLVKNGGAVRLQTVGILSTNKSELPIKLIQNYLSHFSPDFLILGGDKNLRSQQAGFGQLYLPELILLLLGFMFMVKSKSQSRLLPLALLLLGPIPAAITKESPHALRAISMVPFVAIISAAGVLSFLKNKFLLYLSITAIFLGFFLNYFLNFLNVYPSESSKDWQYGYMKIFTDYKNEFPKYDRVIISDEYAQPYIFVLFYQKFDPESFRQTVERNSVEEWGFSTVSSFDKFEFGKVTKLYKSGSKRTLIFASKDEKLPTLIPVGMIKFLDGTTAFWIYEL